MLKALPADEEAEGLFVIASKPQRRDDGSPDGLGPGAPE